MRNSISWSTYIQTKSGVVGNHVFQTPSGIMVELRSLQVIWTSSGTVGNRQLEVQLGDPAFGTIYSRMVVGAVQAASLTFKYNLGPMLLDLTAMRDTTFLMSVLPNWILDDHLALRVIDNKAIDAAADTAISSLIAAAYPM